jgi:hypothetical protein
MPLAAEITDLELPFVTYYLTMTTQTAPTDGQALDVLHELSLMLKTGLDKETLAICMQMIDQGINPEALAAVVKELKREKKQPL